MKTNPEDINEYVIFASDINDNDTELFMKESEVPFKRLYGQYKGIGETSFIINKDNLPLVRSLTRKQESILLLSKMQDNGTRKAILEFNNGILENLGDMREVTREMALKSDGFTRDGNTYFVAGGK